MSSEGGDWSCASTTTTRFCTYRRRSHWVPGEAYPFADYARIGRAQSRGGSHVAAANEWSSYLADLGASGEGRIMYPGPSNKTLAELVDTGFTAGLVIQEIMQTNPASRVTTSENSSGCTCRGRRAPASVG